MLFWYVLALLIIFAWTAVMLALAMTKFKDRLEARGVSLAGPFILWKTNKGKKLIEGVAEKRARLVEWYGKATVVVTGIAMVTMFTFLVWAAILAIERLKQFDLEPHMLLGLPGLNPLIPLWYGIFALAVAMVVHEFSHGILSALAKVKIKSLGLLFFILPMGAFVEPDEEELKKIDKKKRVRMYSAGPASNIIVAAICSVIFSVILMGSVHPVAPGAGITNVEEGSAADLSGLEAGMVMVSFNGVPVDEYQDFSRAVGTTRANQTVAVGIYDPGVTGEVRFYNATLTDKSLATERDSDTGKGYLGVNTMTVSTAHFHPISGADELGGVIKSISMYVVLPLQGLSPVSGSTQNFYEVSGFWSFLPDDVFWIIANAFYWLFWLNLMVGLTNALPAVPLDGGYIFKDWLDSFFKRRHLKRTKASVRKLKEKVSREVDAGRIPQQEEEVMFKKGLRNYIKKEEKARAKVVDRITISLALLILFLILWQVIGPRVL
jgi:membrane-associated protease RseP (regulator of RpoE activity)